MCVAAQSRSRVGLWQLSLRRGCADQDWAEYQGLAVLKGELHDSSPTWESYLLAAASPTVPSPPEPSREDICLSDLPMTAWLTQWLCVCLTWPPVCLWSNDWLALLCFARVKLSEISVSLLFVCPQRQYVSVPSFNFFMFYLHKLLVLGNFVFINQMEGSHHIKIFNGEFWES